jgi:hypothetical protein
VNRRNRPQKLDREHAAVRKNVDHHVEGSAEHLERRFPKQ